MDKQDVTIQVSTPDDYNLLSKGSSPQDDVPAGSERTTASSKPPRIKTEPSREQSTATILSAESTRLAPTLSAAPLLADESPSSSSPPSNARDTKTNKSGKSDVDSQPKSDPEASKRMKEMLLKAQKLQKNLLDADEDLKESYLSKLLSKLLATKNRLNSIYVSPKYLGQTTMWHFSLVLAFTIVFCINQTLNILFLVRNVGVLWHPPPTLKLDSWVEMFATIVLYVMFIGFTKEAFRLSLYVWVLFTVGNSKTHYWKYVLVAHSPLYLTLLPFESHRRKALPALNALGHPKVVAIDIFFADIPFAIISVLYQNYYNQIDKWSTFAIISVLGTLATTFIKLSRFTYWFLDAVNEKQKARAQSKKIKRHLGLWAKGLEYQIGLLGDPEERGDFLEHILSKVPEVEKSTSSFVRARWRNGFKSILFITTLQSFLNLIASIHRFKPEKIDGRDTKAEYERLLQKYDPEIRYLNIQNVWNVAITPNIIEAINALWKCQFIQLSYRGLLGVHKDKWEARRITKLAVVNGPLRSPMAIASLTTCSLELMAYCLSNATRILQPDFEPTEQDLKEVPISLTETLGKQLLKAESYHIRDKQLANNLCIYDIPDSADPKALKIMLPLSQTIFYFADISAFDVLITEEIKIPLNEPEPTSLPKRYSVKNNITDQKSEITTTTLSRFRTRLMSITKTTTKGRNTAEDSTDALAEPKVRTEKRVMTKLQKQLEVFEKICSVELKNSSTGVVVVWKNYRLFKDKIRATTFDFSEFYRDYPKNESANLSSEQNAQLITRYFKKRFVNAAKTTDRYCSIIPDWQQNPKFDFLSLANELIFDHYVMHGDG
ncbi:hypothetical protein BKA69DRAFT_707858 [Paraphysoderma sedebokerense]|nr:hypothetical protein BKA69DRAFT_707858 [Paraphysoderma sedebokerense]